MPEVVTIEVPPPDPPVPTKWDREYAAFRRLLPDLLRTHRGQYVAVHDGAVVGSGPDMIAVAREAYGRFGAVEILVRLVTDEPPRVARILSPQLVGGG